MFNTILWPVDGSPLSIKPLQAVIGLAQLSSAKVLLLSIAEPRLYRASDTEALRSGRDAEAIRLDAARHEVAKLRSAVRQAGVACYDIVSLAPVPGDEILNTAWKVDCDLIVMATHAKMGVIDTLLSSSTTQQVIMSSRVPVMVFP